MKHDQFWKTTLWIFFREFMELFFPEESNHPDFTRIKLLDKEIFTDLPQGSCESRIWTMPEKASFCT